MPNLVQRSIQGSLSALQRRPDVDLARHFRNAAPAQTPLLKMLHAQRSKSTAQQHLQNGGFARRFRNFRKRNLNKCEEHHRPTRCLA